MRERLLKISFPDAPCCRFCGEEMQYIPIEHCWLCPKCGQWKEAKDG